MPISMEKSGPKKTLPASLFFSFCLTLLGGHAALAANASSRVKDLPAFRP